VTASFNVSTLETAAIRPPMDCHKMLIQGLSFQPALWLEVASLSSIVDSGISNYGLF
jgi:hypothetical protein